MQTQQETLSSNSEIRWRKVKKNGVVVCEVNIDNPLHIRVVKDAFGSTKVIEINLLTYVLNLKDNV